jgi:hypothetical protein
MKLLITTLAGVALIALAGCNRVGATNNAAGNQAANASTVAAPAGNGATAKPADDGGDTAAPADNAAGAGGDKPADGGTATETSSEDQPPAEGEGGK